MSAVIPFASATMLVPGLPLPLVRRLLARNPSPFTFTGTGTFVVGQPGGTVAVIDPGPVEPAHGNRVARYRTCLGLQQEPAPDFPGALGRSGVLVGWVVKPAVFAALGRNHAIGLTRAHRSTTGHKKACGHQHTNGTEKMRQGHGRARGSTVWTTTGHVADPMRMRRYPQCSMPALRRRAVAAVSDPQKPGLGSARRPDGATPPRFAGTLVRPQCP